MLGLAPATDKVIHLYKNDVTPSSSSVIGTFTECTEFGYAPQTLAMGDWSVALDMTGTGAIGSHAPITFTFTEAVTVYGYYVTDTGVNLLWAERFTMPFSLGAGGGDIGISPIIECV